MKTRPVPIYFHISNNVPISDWQWSKLYTSLETKIMRMDLNDCLCDTIEDLSALLQIKLPLKEEYGFCLLSKGTDEDQITFLHSNVPLSDQKVTPLSIILIFPASSLLKMTKERIVKTHVSGWVRKSSFESGKNISEKRVFAVLADSFLFYFKAEDKPTPLQVVPLNYYLYMAPDLVDQPDFVFKKANLKSWSDKSDVHNIKLEEKNTLRQWSLFLKKQCASGASRCFGISLEKICKDYKRKDHIPSILTKCFSYLSQPKSLLFRPNKFFFVADIRAEKKD